MDKFSATWVMPHCNKGDDINTTTVEMDSTLCAIFGYNLKYRRVRMNISGSIAKLYSYDFTKIENLMYCSHIKKIEHNMIDQSCDSIIVKLAFNTLDDFNHILNSLPLYYFSMQDTFDDIVLNDFTEVKDDKHTVPLRRVINKSISSKPNNKFTLLLGPSIFSKSKSLKFIDTGNINELIKRHKLNISDTGTLYTTKYGLFTNSLLVPSYFIYPKDYLNYVSNIPNMV